MILISVLGLYFIQKINQQNHKINTMVDLVATLSEQMNMLRSMSSMSNNIDVGGSSLSTDTPFTQNDQHMLSSDDTHKVNMIHVSDGEEGSSGSDIEYDESDEEESDEEESGEDSDDEDSDDEDSDDEQENSSVEEEDKKDILDVKSQEIEKIEDEVLEIPDLSIDEVQEDPVTLKSISIDIDDDDDDDEVDTGVKTLDVVMDYKKASLSKLREIVQTKGLVTDASKMKKADILRVLESE